MEETRLILSQGGFPPFTARGCSQSLYPLESALLRRTVNGKLISLGAPGQLKYRSVIRCEDEESPALEGLWPGTFVEVHCIQYLWQKTFSPRLSLSRTPRIDSLKAIDQKKRPYGVKWQNNEAILETEEQEGPWYLGYQPILTMTVITHESHHQEWGDKNPWSITLEET